MCSSSALTSAWLRAPRYSRFGVAAISASCSFVQGAVVHRVADHHEANVVRDANRRASRTNAPGFFSGFKFAIQATCFTTAPLRPQSGAVGWKFGSTCTGARGNAAASRARWYSVCARISVALRMPKFRNSRSSRRCGWQPRRGLRLDAAIVRDAPDHLAAVVPRVERRDAGVRRADELQNDVGPLARERSIEAHDVEERAVAPQRRADPRTARCDSPRAVKLGIRARREVRDVDVIVLRADSR